MVGGEVDGLLFGFLLLSPGAVLADVGLAVGWRVAQLCSDGLVLTCNYILDVVCNLGNYRNELLEGDGFVQSVLKGLKQK